MDFRSIRNVELISLGKHKAMTGPFELKPEHVASIIEASVDPYIRDAVLKIGHLDDRFAFHRDGEPGYGWVRNLRAESDKLVGDYASMPAMLAELTEGDDEHPAPYRSRSVEIAWDVETPQGKKYPAVLTAVALLGVQPPAVMGLQDVYRMYEPVAAAHLPDTQTVIVVTDGTDMAASGADVEAVNENGDNLESDGTNQEDTTVDLAELRTQLGLPEDADEDAVKAKLEELKSEAAKVADLEPKAAKADELEPKVQELEQKVAAGAPPPEGFTVVDANLLTDLQTKAAAGADAAEKWASLERNNTVAEAIKAGKISPFSRDAVTEQMRQGILSADTLASMPVVFPTATPVGHSDSPDNITAGQVDDSYPQEWLTDEERARIKAREAV